MKEMLKRWLHTWIFSSLIGFCDLSDFESACIFVKIPNPDLFRVFLCPTILIELCSGRGERVMMAIESSSVCDG